MSRIDKTRGAQQIGANRLRESLNFGVRKVENMWLIIIPLVLIGAILYTAMPLLQDPRPQDARWPPAEGGWDDLRGQKAEIIAKLKDLEMDQRMGKLSSRDYQELRAELERQAVTLFRRLEKGGNSGGRKAHS
ncbi:MAG: hypothetical protein ACE5JX_19670 [Acidobacteriota bacterium]